MTVSKQVILFTSCLLGLVIALEEPTTPRLQQSDSSRGRPGRRGAQRNASSRHNTTTLQNENNPRSSADEDEDLMGQAIALLQRLNDRLTALQALDEQQLRRLETLEYRLTKLEVQQQEKGEGLRSDLREVMRRVQQLDWQASKMDSVLEAIKLDTSGLSQGQDHLRGMLSVPEGRYSSIAENDTRNKLQVMTTALLVVKGTTASIQERLVHIQSNITKLNNMTKQVLDLGNKLVTKQHFKSAILDMQEQTKWPLQAIASLHTTASDEEHLPWDCQAVQQEGHNQSGLYKIRPPFATKSFFAYCDMEKSGGGWTVIQNRYEGSVDFYRDWDDYKRGFGNLGGEFWLGLEKIHLLTSHRVSELYIELTDFSFAKTSAHYSAFAISDEKEGYAIQILGGYDGDAGDSLIYHAGMKFSTSDMDNDAWNDGNCAESHTGAWWYNGCDTSNLNGRYLGGEVMEDYEYQGMYWYDWHGPMYSLMKTYMAVRPSSKLPTLLENRGGDKLNHTNKKQPKDESPREGSRNSKPVNDYP